MNTKLILSGLSIVTAMALMAGGTFAYFSSTATSTGNVFSTGTLNLQVDDSNDTPATTITATFGGTLLPGGSTSGYISLHNNGSIPIALVKLGATETTPSNPNLAAKLNITSAVVGTDQTCSENPTQVTGLTTLAALNGATVKLPGSDIAVGSTKFLCMTFTLDSGTDDTYQGTSIAETFSFEGDQTTSQ